MGQEEPWDRRQGPQRGWLLLLGLGQAPHPHLLAGQRPIHAYFLLIPRFASHFQSHKPILTPVFCHPPPSPLAQVIGVRKQKPAQGHPPRASQEGLAGTASRIKPAPALQSLPVPGMKQSGRGYDGERGEEEPTGRQKWVRSRGKEAKVGQSSSQKAGGQAGLGWGAGSPGQVEMDPAAAAGGSGWRLTSG